VYVSPPGTEQQQQQQQGDGGAAVPSKRLGYLSFDSNERSGHQARELKSVHVSIDAVALRLVVHRCHVNKLNIYNQVGVVALNLIGEPLSGAPSNGAPAGAPAYLDPTQQQPPGEMGYYNRCEGLRAVTARMRACVHACMHGEEEEGAWTARCLHGRGGVPVV